MSRAEKTITGQAFGRRLYLLVPYSEKGEAKAAGARWDPVTRLWWIERSRVGGSPQVHRWIVDDATLKAHAKAAAEWRGKTSPRPPKAHKPSRSTPITRPQRTFLLPSCSCPVAPWDACEHTATVDHEQPTLQMFTAREGRPHEPQCPPARQPGDSETIQTRSADATRHGTTQTRQPQGGMAEFEAQVPKAGSRRTLETVAA